MNTLASAFQIVYKVYQKDVPLAKVAKEFFNEHDYNPEARKMIKKTAVVLFKNQYALFKIIKDCFPDARQNDYYIIATGLADLLFVKSISLEENINTVFDLLKMNKSTISNDMVNRLFNNICRYKQLIPDSVSINSREYMSLKYNLPMWIVELWTKHYGKVPAEKLMQCCKTWPYKTLRINRMRANKKELLNDYRNELESGSSMTDTTVNYIPHKSLMNLEAIDQGKVIPLSEGVNHLINKLRFNNNEEILFVDVAHSNMYLGIAEASQDKNQIYVYRTNEEDRLAAKKQIERYGFKNVELASGPIHQLITVISNPKDKVFVLPKSTAFNTINAIPDFFVHVRQEMLDEIIDNERTSLEEGAKYVADNGNLIYVIETANNKEGSLLIKSFLVTHPEFRMVEERQTLQFDKRHTSCYFAILRKLGKE